METRYLAHHGVKGMKWGVRRTPEQLGHRKSNRANKENYKAAKQNAKTEYKAEKAAARARLEKAYERNQREYDENFSGKERAALENRQKLKQEAYLRSGTKAGQYTAIKRSLDESQNRTLYSKSDYLKNVQADKDSAAYSQYQREKTAARNAYKTSRSMAKAKYRRYSKSGKTRFYDSRQVKDLFAAKAAEVEKA